MEPDTFLARLARARPQPWWRNVLTGLAFAGAGLAVRLAAQVFYAEVTGFIILLPAVVLAALAAGRVAGLTAVVASLLGGWVIAGPDALGVGIASTLGRVATVNFIIVGLFCTVVAASLRKTVSRLDGAAVDLSASQAQIDASETRFRDISDIAPVMLWTADASGRVYVNAEFRRFWGDRPLSLDDITPWREAVHPEDRDRVFAASIAARQSRGSLEIEARYRRADGAWCVLRTRAEPRFDASGDFTGMVGANVDVTEMRAAEGAVSRSAARFRAAIEANRGVLWTNTADGRMEGEQPGWSALTGQTESEYSGHGWSAVVHPDDIQSTMEAWNTAVAYRRTFVVEHRLKMPGGDYRTFAVRAVPTLDDSGALVEWVGVHTDVTEAKTAESALRESEERFRLMADTAPAPVWLTNAGAEVEFVNAALVAFYGRPGETFMGHAWKASVHPDDRPAVDAIQTEARLTNAPYGFEARFERHDGVWRWMRVSVNPRVDGGGTFQGYVGMSFDVTETREALNALAAQERRQRLLLEMADGVRELEDPQAIMDHVQSVLGRLLGVSRVGYCEISQDRTTVETLPDWTEGVPSATGQHLLASFGGKIDAEMFLGLTVAVDDVAADARTEMALSTFKALQVGALVAVPLFRSGEMRAFLQVHSIRPRVWTQDEIALIADVADRTWSDAERARAEAELRESEARFRDIADTAPVLIWVTNADRSRAFVNQAYVDYLGGDYESARTADWRTFIHPDDQAGLMAESLAGEATGEPFALEARYLHHSGEHRWLKSFSRPRLGPGGAVIGFVGVAFDVTDARRVEADLKRINELLEERVGDALAEKAKAEADLMHAQRMEAVGRLTGGVAHDFNNLLTVVIGALDLILKSPDDAARRLKLGEAALSAARRGERLTHQLLAFSRRQALRPETIDINALIRESDPLLRRAVGEAVSYKLKLKRGGVRVIVDPAQFEAALLNLIVNARDAVAGREEGQGAAIMVQTQACQVEAGEVIELAPGDYVCVTVSDTGTGMDDATMLRVFEPFFTTKSVGKGTGLGLSQVYGFARQSGGGVKVTSTVGEGTEVRVYLPPAPIVTESEAPASAAKAMTPMSDQRLLLVEDDVSVAAIALEILTEVGLSVRTVETGAEALTALASEPFDIMLSDIVMPGGMTGIQLARSAAALYPSLRIVLTSGYAGDDVDEALVDAPWPFIRKPYSGEQLAEALGRASHPDQV